MRKTLSLLGALSLVAFFAVGCAGPESKMGRGLGNMTEIVRGGEMSRGVEQGGLFGGTDQGVFTGFIRGAHKTFVRTGVGIYEVVTAPFPPYDPVFTDYLNPRPMYPDAYRPRIWAGPIFDSDTYSGFSGGNVAPFFPGNKFYIFED